MTLHGTTPATGSDRSTVWGWVGVDGFGGVVGCGLHCSSWRSRLLLHLWA